MEHKSFYQIFRHEGLSFGWKHAKKDIFFFLKVFLIVAVLTQFIPIFMDAVLNPSPYSIFTRGDAVSALFSVIFGFGLMKIYVHYIHNRTPRVNDLIIEKEEAKSFVNRILARLGAQLLILLGLFLLIVPGIYIAARFYFVEFFVVDKKMTAEEAMRASRKITKGHVWEIIGICVLSFGIILLGILALVVGLLWAMPTIYLAQATLYKKLTSHDHHEA